MSHKTSRVAYSASKCQIRCTRTRTTGIIDITPADNDVYLVSAGNIFSRRERLSNTGTESSHLIRVDSAVLTSRDAISVVSGDSHVEPPAIRFCRESTRSADKSDTGQNAICGFQKFAVQFCRHERGWSSAGRGWFGGGCCRREQSDSGWTAGTEG